MFCKGINARIFARAAGLAVALASTASTALAVLYTPGQASVDRAGNAEYSVAITPVPGTAGMVPSISLNYNSSISNGPLAWAGNSATILDRPMPRDHRHGEYGRRRSAGRHGPLLLDGQKLVVKGTGTYGADGTEYRTESESFTKVISYGNAGGGPAWFKVWTKSGQIKEYGNTANSRIEPPGSTVAHTWALNKVSDRSGNYYTVVYSENTSTGEAVVERIDYTGTPAQGKLHHLRPSASCTTGARTWKVEFPGFGGQ